MLSFPTNTGETSRVNDLYILERAVVRVRRHQSNVLHDAHALAHTTENGVLSYFSFPDNSSTIQPRCRRQRDEELAAVRVWTRIRLSVKWNRENTPWQEYRLL